MKALKNLGQGIAGNLGGGKLRNAMGGLGGGKLKKAMGGLGKGMLMEDGGRMKYPGGGRMSNRRLARMLAKYMMGGKMKMEHGGKHYMHGGVHEMEHGGKHYGHGGVHEMEHGGKHYRHGGAHDSSGPILNPFDDSEMAQVQRRERERSMIDQGLLSKPGEGVTISFGEGSPVDFQTVQKKFREDNPDLFDPSKDYELLDGERVFFTRGVVDPDDPEGFFQRIVRPADTRGLKRESTDTYTDILRGLMSEFDNYVASFGDEVKNNPEAIQKAREKFKKEARNVAEQMEERRFG